MTPVFLDTDACVWSLTAPELLVLTLVTRDLNFAEGPELRRLW